MKERAIFQRNMLGAFMGGVLGILICGFLSPLLLPVGVFAGVIGGWWYQEIWAATTHGFNEGMAKTCALAAFLFTPVRRLGEWRKQLWNDSVGDVMLPILAWLVSPIIWLLRRPAVIVMWTRAHTVNRAYLVRAATLPLFYAMNAAIIGFLANLLVRSAQGFDFNHDVRGIPIIFGGIFLFCIGIISLMAPMMSWSSDSERKLDQMHHFYRTWERYSSMGVARFYLSELWFLARAWFSAVAWAVACISWFCGLGAVYLAIVAVASAAIGFVKGIYRVSIRGGHWLCFGATLTTTIVSAMLFHNSFGDIRIMWFVAVLTGVASAGATEGLRQGILLFFNTNRPARVVAVVPLIKQLRPSGHLFWRTSTRVGDWFIGLLPTHPQNA